MFKGWKATFVHEDGCQLVSDADYDYQKHSYVSCHPPGLACVPGRLLLKSTVLQNTLPVLLHLTNNYALKEHLLRTFVSPRLRR